MKVERGPPRAGLGRAGPDRPAPGTPAGRRWPDGPGVVEGTASRDSDTGRSKGLWHINMRADAAAMVPLTVAKHRATLAVVTGWSLSQAATVIMMVVDL